MSILLGLKKITEITSEETKPPCLKEIYTEGTPDRVTYVDFFINEALTNL